jgi:hypothetical protein
VPSNTSNSIILLLVITLNSKAANAVDMCICYIQIRESYPNSNLDGIFGHPNSNSDNFSVKSSLILAIFLDLLML